MRPYGGWGVWGGGSARPWVLHCASVAPDGLRYGGALRTVAWWHLVASGVWWGMESHGMVAFGVWWDIEDHGMVAFGVWWGMEDHGMVALGGIWGMVGH